MLGGNNRHPPIDALKIDVAQDGKTAKHILCNYFGKT
jgi:hypothetical protein